MDSGIVEQLRAALAATGRVHVRVHQLSVSPAAWCQAARDAGRQLERPVVTLVTDRYVTAALADAAPGESQQGQISSRIQAALATAHHAAAVHAEIFLIGRDEPIRVRCDCTIGKDHEHEKS